MQEVQWVPSNKKGGANNLAKAWAGLGVHFLEWTLEEHECLAKGMKDMHVH